MKNANKVQYFFSNSTEDRQCEKCLYSYYEFGYFSRSENDSFNICCCKRSRGIKLKERRFHVNPKYVQGVKW